MAKERVETELGPLSRDREGWHGSISFQERMLWLLLRPTRTVPLATLVDLVIVSRDQLAGRAERAKLHAFAAEPKVPPSMLTLEGVQASLPDPEWLRQHKLPSEPVLILTFAIAEERNVLDVIFQGSEPVALEYH